MDLGYNGHDEILFPATKQATASGHIAFSIGFALMLYIQFCLA